MDRDYIRDRITELRIKKNVSEYRMSMELGKNRAYLNGISSGRSMPSLEQFLEICDYFEITPLQFFDSKMANPQLNRKIMDKIRLLDDNDLILLLNIIDRFLSYREML